MFFKDKKNNKSCKNKKKSYIMITVVCLLGIILFIVFAIFWSIIPHIKTNFNSYVSFTNYNEFFPTYLPDTASDIKYYSYRGFYDDAKGLAFTLSETEYNEIKNTYEKKYPYISAEKIETLINLDNTNSDEDINLDVFEPVREDIVQNEKFSFVESLAKNDIYDYSILTFNEPVEDNTTKVQLIKGVFVNDKTKRVIIFYYNDRIEF